MRQFTNHQWWRYYQSIRIAYIFGDALHTKRSKKVQCYGYSNPFVQKITHGNYNRKNSNLNQIGNKGMIRKQSQYWAGLAMAAGGQRKEGCLIREWGA